ncbi:unnamed protein product [Callosobruchus maculatus]|nr:unnamed protein product [Callosobruchus maculatus]
MICIDKYGINYQKCVKHLPARSAVQIKMRYRNCCRMLVKRSEYSLQEDSRIMGYVKQYGTKIWGPLANELNRSTGLLRQRYKTISNFLNRHPDKTIKDVPRRKSNVDGAEMKRYQLSRSVADKYKDQPIPSLEELEDDIEYLYSLETIASNTVSDEVVDRKKPRVDKEEQRIDWKLVEFFTSLENKQTTGDEKPHDLCSTMHEVETALNSLQSKLNIQTDVSKNMFLDSTDLDILYEYKSHPSNFEQSDAIQQSTETLVPPNLNTCLALKNLLINHAKHKQYVRPKMNVKDCSDSTCPKHELSVYTKTYCESQKKTILSQTNIFYHRFYKLFKWPSILSCTHPNLGLLYGSQHMPTQGVAKRYYKHYSKQHQPVNSVSVTNGTKSRNDCLKFSINSPKRSTSDRSCTETFKNGDVSEKSKSVHSPHLSIRIIRNVKKGTEVVKVVPDTEENRSSERHQLDAKDNSKITPEITVNAVVKRYSHEAQSDNEKGNYRDGQFKNVCLDGYLDGEYSKNLSALLHHNNTCKAELPYSFVNIKQENVSSDDIQL